MSILEIILIGVGVSMDAFAVSLTNGMVFKELPLKKTIAVPLFFAFFQGLMPLLGFSLGTLFASIITDYAKYAVLLILGLIGIKTMKEGLFKENKDPSCEIQDKECKFSYKILLLQAVATSIDAFAVGISLSLVAVDLALSLSIIVSITFALCLLALFLGRRFGSLLGSRAEIAGGLILIVIAVKSIF